MKSCCVITYGLRCTLHQNSHLEEQQWDAYHDHRIATQHTAGEAVVYLTLPPLAVYQHPLGYHPVQVINYDHVHECVHSIVLCE